jgi:hypothetical protein
MAVLSDPRRQACCQELMAELSGVREALNVTKADLQAAVNAADDYQNANAAAMKQAIPQPARGAMTNSQLARMVNMVNRYRYIDGS